MVELLLGAGALVDLKTAEGFSPVDLAIQQDQHEICAVLKAAESSQGSVRSSVRVQQTLVKVGELVAAGEIDEEEAMMMELAALEVKPPPQVGITAKLSMRPAPSSGSGSSCGGDGSGAESSRLHGIRSSRKPGDAGSGSSDGNVAVSILVDGYQDERNEEESSGPSQRTGIAKRDVREPSRNATKRVRPPAATPSAETSPETLGIGGGWQGRSSDSGGGEAGQKVTLRKARVPGLWGPTTRETQGVDPDGSPHWFEEEMHEERFSLNSDGSIRVASVKRTNPLVQMRQAEEEKFRLAVAGQEESSPTIAAGEPVVTIGSIKALGVARNKSPFAVQWPSGDVMALMSELALERRSSNSQPGSAIPMVQVDDEDEMMMMEAPSAAYDAPLPPPLPVRAAKAKPSSGLGPRMRPPSESQINIPPPLLTGNRHGKHEMTGDDEPLYDLTADKRRGVPVAYVAGTQRELEATDSIALSPITALAIEPDLHQFLAGLNLVDRCGQLADDAGIIAPSDFALFEATELVKTFGFKVGHVRKIFDSLKRKGLL
jgi:hypothetical protein